MKRVRGKSTRSFDRTEWSEQQVYFASFLLGIAAGLLLLILHF